MTHPDITAAERQPSAVDEQNALPDEHMAFSDADIERDPIEQTHGIPEEVLLMTETQVDNQ